MGIHQFGFFTRFGTEAVVRRCSVKKVKNTVLNIYRKTPVLESLFNKVSKVFL